MQIDRRYADYALTGGFFLICQLGMVWALGYWPQLNLDAIKGSLPFPIEAPFVATIITGFAGALAVISVFVAGLILDLLASVYRYNEMQIFARHLDFNSSWMSPLIEDHKTYCDNDYQAFRRALNEMPSFREARAAVPAMLTLWKSESRLRVTAIMKKGIGLRIVPEYERLLSFFTSYVMGEAGTAQLTLMADQYSLWRTSRAIAVALYLLTGEAILFLIGAIYVAMFKVFFRGIPSFDYFLTANMNLLLMLCLAALSAGTILIVRGTFSRFCFTLFSLLYVACDKRIRSREAGPLS